jgi:YD repeat-containing protein
MLCSSNSSHRFNPLHGAIALIAALANTFACCYGTFTSIEYDTLSRRTAEVDQAGKRTQYGYDTLGRLVQVTDAVGNITRYAYNEIGQQIGQIDALNRVTRDRRLIVLNEGEKFQ